MTMSAPSSDERDRNRSETRIVRVDGEREIAYAEYGRSNGTPLVFFHGTPGSRRLGALLDRAARRHDVRVLAPERPGYGRSSPWPNRSVADAAEFVTPVLDDAGVDTARLVAFSGGGPYALSTAGAHPERGDH
ncbi:alpha/beta fold hydrolase, partial [uncultured Halovibrio sp.]|uniref:alpha/beta fold hydrolase n=1 Tax=uncultured Halovibrio sp. TaxID=985049 RepID=UPI0025FAEB77